MAMDKEKQIVQTRAMFEVSGKLFNLKSEKAFSVNDKGNWRTANLGLRISDSEVMFIQIKGGERKEVYLSKPGKNKGDKGEVTHVEWKDRFKAQRDGFKVMGVNLGLVKGEDGKNVLVSMTEWDAWEYLKENAKDDMDVFITGDIEYSSYVKEGETEVRHNQNFVAKKIYLSTNPIDFQSEKFEKRAGFSQNAIILNRINEKEQYFLEVGYVGYGSYETVALQCTQVMYDAIKSKNVRPYNSITLTGVLKTSQEVEQVKTEDTWGEKSTVGVPKSTAKTVLFVDGARGETLSKDTYTQKMIEKYLSDIQEAAEEKKSKESSFASQGGGSEKKGEDAWGAKGGVAEDTEDLPW